MDRRKPGKPSASNPTAVRIWLRRKPGRLSAANPTAVRILLPVFEYCGNPTTRPPLPGGFRHHVAEEHELEIEGCEFYIHTVCLKLIYVTLCA
ncbi:hypothetical protein AVEN_136370-1 [Araneus ventricosus]|uniref:Uncharacterized protein n=1 Tax=Araneus ventricosus TaxID=182803 RepID=A0A4Y2JT51_ARAVE|nr:hypothetical protein AVEN_136370-1 [Araneus ventricosus]